MTATPGRRKASRSLDSRIEAAHHAWLKAADRGYGPQCNHRVEMEKVDARIHQLKARYEDLVERRKVWIAKQRDIASRVLLTVVEELRSLPMSQLCGGSYSRKHGKRFLVEWKIVTNHPDPGTTQLRCWVSFAATRTVLSETIFYKSWE